MTKGYSKAAAGTFVLNKGEPIHRWYAYLEGYSSCLIDDLIQEIGIDSIQTIYDPFCGTGTTCLVAAKYGITSYYSETNPFMQKVIRAKTKCVKALRDTGVGSELLRKLLQWVETYTYQFRFADAGWDGFEKYFEPDVLCQLKDLMSEVDRIPEENTREIATVLLASVIVRSSKMIRQGDLRFAKDGEKTDDDRNIVKNFAEKVAMAIADIDGDEQPIRAEAVCLSEDARESNAESIVDCVITSPPYLNGTNYIRNTKLELKLAGIVTSEKDLPLYHSKGIIVLRK